MPTQRCSNLADEGRCPGVFAYSLAERPNGSVVQCPLCGMAHRWDAIEEEWVVNIGSVPDL
ncbi:MAG TPA: hypothetical protein VHE80_11555 [Acidimicrobiales bacterium]|nr:hypothetical protein [Acidimicrobiales bacterium]